MPPNRPSFSQQTLFGKASSYDTRGNVWGYALGYAEDRDQSRALSLYEADHHAGLYTGERLLT